MGLFALLRSLPVVGPVLRIANAYAFQGDHRSDYEFASARLWGRAIGRELLIAVVLTGATLWPLIHRSWLAKNLVTCGEDFYCKPGILIVAVVPSTLGFGIGVYALIFALSEVFLKSIKEAIDRQKIEGKRKVGSELMLNSDLAFPLLVLTVCLLFGVAQQVFSSSSVLIALSWLVFWYALISILDLIAVIFGMAENSLLHKSTPPPP